MASDGPNQEDFPRRPSTAEERLGAIAHDARNGLASIVARAQLLGRRLRRGDPVDVETVAGGLGEIERVAKRTAQRITEIEDGFAARIPGQGDPRQP